MPNNLALLERHRQKMWLLIALIIYLFIFTCISVFWIASVYFISQNENELLRLKSQRVMNVLQISDVILDENNEALNEISKNIIKGSVILEGNVVIYNDSILDLPIINEILSTSEVYYLNGNKYKSSMFLSEDNEEIQFITSTPAKNFVSFNLQILIWFIIGTLILYWLLAFIGCRLMTKIYRPIKNIIENLENFALNINHEFKTSLSEIISTLQLAQITKDYDDGVNQAVQSSKRLNNILDSLGYLIHFNNSEYRREKIDIVKHLDEAIYDFQQMMNKKKIIICKNYEINKKIFKNIDKDALLLCFNNIFKNAIRYSHESGKIEIDIRQRYFRIKDFWVELMNTISKKFLTGILEKITLEKGFELVFLW